VFLCVDIMQFFCWKFLEHDELFARDVFVVVAPIDNDDSNKYYLMRCTQGKMKLREYFYDNDFTYEIKRILSCWLVFQEKEEQLTNNLTLSNMENKLDIKPIKEEMNKVIELDHERNKMSLNLIIFGIKEQEEEDKLEIVKE
jgi:hypothetical protein